MINFVAIKFKRKSTETKLKNFNSKKIKKTYNKIALTKSFLRTVYQINKKFVEKNTFKNIYINQKFYKKKIDRKYFPAKF